MDKANGKNAMAQIEGKLQEVIHIDGRNGTFFKNIILVPGQDNYDYPNPLAVMSSRKIGREGDVVKASVQLQGRVQKGANATFHNVTLWEII